VYGEVRKVGGVLGIIQGTASVDFVGCSNSGTIVTTTVTHYDIGDKKDYTTGADGLGGIVAYANAATTLKDCSNTGAIQTAAGNTGAAVGGLIGKCGSVTITDLGGNSCAANMKMIGVRAGTITGFLYATVDNNVATTISGSIAAGGDYLLEGNATPVIELASGESIAFDTALGYTLTESSITAASGLELSTSTSGTKKTFSAGAPAAADWADDPATVSNETAAVAYPDLAGTALANADAYKLTVWAGANNVDYSDVTAAPGDYVEAYMLNCALADVDDEKADFKVNITMGADGTPVVTTPEGKSYNVTPTLKGATSLTGEWTTVSEGSTSYQFYKAVLSL
jgi:hypothetical protein